MMKGVLTLGISRKKYCREKPLVSNHISESARCTGVGIVIPSHTKTNCVMYSEINFLVMDYLINEGYPEAAKRFSAEANIQRAPGDTENIQERVEIRNAILAGNIQTAIENINDLTPEVRSALSAHTDCHTILSLLVFHLAMIKTSFMHHSYCLRADDDSKYLLQSS